MAKSETPSRGRMAPLLFVGVFSVPLVWHTFGVARDELSNPEKHAGKDPVAEITDLNAVSANDAKLLAETATKQAAIDRIFLGTLLTFDPIGTRPAPNLETVTPTNRFMAMKDSMPQLKQSRDTLTRFMDIYEYELSEKDELDQLKQFKEEFPLDEVPGGKKLSLLINRRLNDMENAAIRKTMLANVTKLLEASNYDKCLKEIKKIPTTGASEVTLDEIERIRSEAEFGEHWRSYLPRVDDPERELDELERLLAGTPIPTSPIQKRKLAKNKLRPAKLNADIAVKNLHRKEFAEIGKGIAKVGEYATEARDVIKQFPQKQPEVEAKFEGWLRDGIGRKKMSIPNYRKELQEALSTQDVWLHGKFLPINDVKAFEYYEWDQNRGTFADQYVTKYESKLKILPREPLDLTCIHEFNDKLDALQDDVFNKSLWQDFSDFCKKATEDIRGYQSIDPKTRELTFDIEEQEAQSVLNVWTDMNYIRTRRSGSNNVGLRLP